MLHTKHCYLQWEEKRISMEITYLPTGTENLTEVTQERPP